MTTTEPPGEFGEQVRADILAAFSPSQESPRPRFRWRPVQWWHHRQYKRRLFALERAQIQARAREAEFAAALPGRMDRIAADLNERLAGVLPEGMRFEWTTEES